MASSERSVHVEARKGGAVPIPTAPGPPPRHMSLAEWHGHLPAFLQIGTIVTPVCAAAAAVWTAVVPRRSRSDSP